MRHLSVVICVMCLWGLCLTGAARAEDPVAALVRESQAEFDAVTAQVKVVAKKLVDRMIEKGRPHRESTSLSWGAVDVKEEMFVEKGELLGEEHLIKLPTQTQYTLAATNKRYTYQVMNVIDVLWTGNREYPLEAKIVIQSTLKTRAVDHQIGIPMTLLPGLRKPTQEELDTLNFVIVEIVPDLRRGGGTGGGSRRALPCFVPSVSDLDELPDNVEKAAEQLPKKCLEAEPVETTTDYEVTFRYSAEKKMWRWWRTIEAKPERKRELRDFGEPLYFSATDEDTKEPSAEPDKP